MKTIVCIDDDRDILESLTLILEKEGYNVKTARNYNMGLEVVKKEKPDAILLDVMMNSDTDGFRLAYAIREDRVLRGIPILMLTSVNKRTGFHFDPGEDGDFLPVDGFLEKPVAPELLTRTIKDVLRKTKKTGEAVETPSA
jgi:DNA-binding response OmpR family regulator